MKLQGLISALLFFIAICDPLNSTYAQSPVKKKLQIDFKPSFMIADNEGNIYIAESHPVVSTQYSIEKFSKEMVSLKYASAKLNYKDIVIHNMIAAEDGAISLIGLYYDKKEDLTKIVSIPLDAKTLLPGQPVTILSAKGEVSPQPQKDNVVSYGISPDRSKFGYMLLTPYGKGKEQTITVVMLNDKGQTLWQKTQRIDYEFPIISKFVLKVSNTGDAAVVGYLRNPVVNKTRMDDQVLCFFLTNEGQNFNPLSVVPSMGDEVKNYYLKDLYLDDNFHAFCQVITNEGSLKDGFKLELLTVETESADVIHTFKSEADLVYGIPLYYFTDTEHNIYCVSYYQVVYQEPQGKTVTDNFDIQIVKFDPEMNMVWQQSIIDEDKNMYENWLCGMHAYMENDTIHILHNIISNEKQKGLKDLPDKVELLDITEDGEIGQHIIGSNTKETGYFMNAPLLVLYDDIYYISRIYKPVQGPALKEELYLIKMKKRKG